MPGVEGIFIFAYTTPEKSRSRGEKFRPQAREVAEEAASAPEPLEYPTSQDPTTKS